MKMLFLTHDCCLAGAQRSFLHILRWCKANTDWDIRVLALGGGPLEQEYAALAPIHVLDGPIQNNLLDTLTDFLGGPPDAIFGNTVVSSRAYPVLARFHRPIITRVAELDSSIDRYATPQMLDSLIRHTTAFVAVSTPVAAMLQSRFEVGQHRIKVINGAIANAEPPFDEQRRASLLARFGVAADAPLLWGCGSISHRKGSDLFLGAAEALLAAGHTHFHAFWAGYPEDDLVRNLFLQKEVSPARNHLSFIGTIEQPSRIMAPGDIFLMTSREDPFPLVSLEAGERGVPTICFPDSGGIVDFAANGGGLVAQAMDPAAMAETVHQLLNDPAAIREHGQKARERVLDNHTMECAGPRFVSLFEACAKGAPGHARPAVHEGDQEFQTHE
jgi:glycosyltransferase involved in cell wall biosynthesis